MVHGGIRYLQHGDVRRVRSSCAERTALLRIAPHLVKPLPIVIPTFGHGLRGKAVLGAGMYAYDLLTAGKNAGISDPAAHIAGARFLSRGEVLELFPELEQPSLTGGAVFADGQMYHAARLVWAFVASAVGAGAVAANYVQAERFLWQDRTVRGVLARDCLNGQQFDIRARLVLNAAGPWAEYLLADAHKFGTHARGVFSRDAYFIIRRPRHAVYGLALPGQSRDRDTLISRSARHLFAVPWRNHTLIGVWHKPFADRPDTAVVQEQEIESWLAEMNASHPALALRRDEICYACCGLVPFGNGTVGAKELSFGHESRYIDHRREHGVAGLVTLVGIRYTTARGDAAKGLDLLLQQWPGKAPAPAPTDRTPLVGGDFASFSALRAAVSKTRPAAISEASLQALLRNHGTQAEALMQLAAQPGESEPLGDSTLMAEVTHAVNSEMAVHLDDVVLRRTDLGSAAHPGMQPLRRAAHRMQALLQWSGPQLEREIEATDTSLRRHHALPVA
jgi:glycerol-3-phosphate dehydrogenase